jgi:hypothetical protein
LCAEIQHGDLLAITAVPSPPIAFGLPDQLLTQQSWLAEHVPDIVNLECGPLEILDGWRAVRTMHAHLSYLDEAVYEEIVYDLPPNGGESDAAAKKRRDTHRHREQEAILSLDPIAEAEHLSKRVRLYASLDPVSAAAKLAKRAQMRAVEAVHRYELRCVIDDVIRRVERQIERQIWDRRCRVKHWHCPAGCTIDCSRAQFRRQCMPSATAISAAFTSEQWRQWRARENIKTMGEFTGPSGYKYSQY